MKTSKHIISFLVLSLLLTVSVNAENLKYTKKAVDNSVPQNHTVNLKSNQGIYLYIDTEEVCVVNVSQPNAIPFSLNNVTSNTSGLVKRSHKLSLIQGCQFQNHNRDFLSKFYTKEIIFPFHSFW